MGTCVQTKLNKTRLYENSCAKGDTAVAAEYYNKALQLK